MCRHFQCKNLFPPILVNPLSRQYEMPKVRKNAAISFTREYPQNMIHWRKYGFILMITALNGILGFQVSRKNYYLGACWKTRTSKIIQREERPTMMSEMAYALMGPEPYSSRSILTYEPLLISVLLKEHQI